MKPLHCHKRRDVEVKLSPLFPPYKTSKSFVLGTAAGCALALSTVLVTPPKNGSPQAARKAGHCNS